MNNAINTWVGNGIGQANPKKPLVILLHGYGAHENDLVSIMDSLPSMPWVAPRAPITVGQQSFGWFPISLPLNPDVATTALATKRLWAWIDEHVAADIPLILIGFSQGGFMASQLLRTRPERILKTAMLAGFVSGYPQIGDQTLAQTKPHVLYCIGELDRAISEAAIDRVHAWAQACTTGEMHLLKNLAHNINATELKILSTYLSV